MTSSRSWPVKASCRVELPDDLGEASLQLGQAKLFELVQLLLDVAMHVVLRPPGKSIGVEDMQACVLA